MTVFKNELNRGKNSLAIWTLSIGFMMAICVLIYPQMGTDMDNLGQLFAQMGGFTQAFGLDKLNFGQFMGFFAIECGNVLGLGGALFAALIGVSSLSKEEKDHTAEFLLTHPISRTQVITEKLAAVFAQLTIMNVAVAAITVLSIWMAGVTADTEKLVLLFAANYIMQLEISAVTFGISACIRGTSTGVGIGLGLATCFYFMNIVANLIEETKLLKYFTPFGYTEGADILVENAINTGYLAAGAALALAGIATAYFVYTKRDIRG